MPSVAIATTVKTRDFNDTNQQRLDHILKDRGMHVVTLGGPVVAQPFSSDKRIAAEVLRQAFADLEDDHGQTRDDATAWFESDEEPGEQPFSFVTICDTLGLCSRNIRAASGDPDRRRVINLRLRKEWNEGGRKA
jgi:hypothetical protein